MDGIQGLIDGFAIAATPENLLYALIGVLAGTFVGVLPGIGPALTIALLLPITYTVAPESAFIMFAGIYYGAMYGGSTTSILLNTPGESGSMMTAIEGNKMARSGRAAAALATAAIGSFVAGTLATLALAFAAPYVVDIAIALGPADYLALMVVAFMTVGALLGTSVARGFASVALGLAIGLIGIDGQSGSARFTFGVPRLLDGIDTVVIIVALFAMSEAIYLAAKMRPGKPGHHAAEGPGLDDPRGLAPLLARMAARHRHRLAARRRPGRRVRDPHLPLLRHREEAQQAPRGVRPRRHRRRRRPRGDQQRQRRRRPDAAAHPGPAHVGHGRRDAGRVPAVRPPARTPAAGDRARPRLGPGRRPAHRQRHAAGAQPAPGGTVGQGAHIPTPYLYAGIVTFSLLGAYSINGSVFDVTCCWSWASSATSCASTATRSHH